MSSCLYGFTAIRMVPEYVWAAVKEDMKQGTSGHRTACEQYVRAAGCSTKNSPKDVFADRKDKLRPDRGLWSAACMEGLRHDLDKVDCTRIVDEKRKWIKVFWQHSYLWNLRRKSLFKQALMLGANSSTDGGIIGTDNKQAIGLVLNRRTDR